MATRRPLARVTGRLRQLPSGDMLPIDVIPTGTTAGTVAAGSHAHAAATILAAGFMSAADKAALEALLAAPRITVSVTPPNDPQLNGLWVDISGA